MEEVFQLSLQAMFQLRVFQLSFILNLRLCLAFRLFCSPVPRNAESYSNNGHEYARNNQTSKLLVVRNRSHLGSFKGVVYDNYVVCMNPKLGHALGKVVSIYGYGELYREHRQSWNTKK